MRIEQDHLKIVNENFSCEIVFYNQRLFFTPENNIEARNCFQDFLKTWERGRAIEIVERMKGELRNGN